MSSRAELDAMIAKLRDVPKLVEEALPEVADEIKEEIGKNIVAQRGPDGVPWTAPKDPETKTVLQNALKAVTSKAIGRVITVMITGPEARHHLGIAKGRIKREIIPTKKLPHTFVNAIERVVGRRLKEGL